MPSPDVTRYVDLTIYDPESQQIYLDALDYAVSALPEFSPREGSIELVLLQAMALEVQEVASAINRLPSAIVEVLLRLLDVQRLDGVRATAYAKFSGVSTTSFFVPSGTRLYYSDGSSSTPLLLETVTSATITHSKVISSVTQTGTTIQVTTTQMHGLSTGNVVSLSGLTPSALNVNSKTITVTGSYTFTLTGDDSASRSATGGTVTPSSVVPAIGLIPVQSANVTSTYNGLPAGTALNLLSVSPQVASVALGTILTGGSEAETDDEYFSRATSTLNRLSIGLVTAEQIQGFVLEVNRFSEVHRAAVSDSTTAGRVQNTVGSMLIAAAPVDTSSTNLLSGVGDGSLNVDDVGYGVLDEIYDAVAARIHASLDVAVTHPAFVKINVLATVGLPDGAAAVDVITACENALNEYLSANTWPWDKTVRVNEIVVLLRNTTVSVGTALFPAASYISSVTLNPADVSVPSTSTANRFSISSITRSSNTATVTVSSNHGIVIDPGETLYIKVAGVTEAAFNTNGLVPATSASGNQFTFTLAGSSSSSGGYVIAAVKKLSNGDIQILDPLPLVESGTHAITVV
jgi:uncharacterized phage protein gp47/JayE